MRMGHEPGYYTRTVEPLTDLKHRLKIAECMGNYVAARVIRAEIETYEARIRPPKKITEENRWDFMIKSSKPITKMDTQGT